MKTYMPTQQTPFQCCQTGKIYFVSLRSFGEQLIFGSSALCVQMLELMKYYRSERSLTHKRVREHKRVSVLSYCINPDEYSILLKQEVENGIEFFCTHINEAIASYYQALFKTKIKVFSRYPVVTEILNNYELITAVRHINVLPSHLDMVHEGIDMLEYPWSSYHELVQRKVESVTHYDEVMKLFGGRAHLRSFIQTGQVPESLL
jgi:hypothetical protein